MVIKPLEEDSTPGTAKPFQVSLVEPVAYHFQLWAPTDQPAASDQWCLDTWKPSFYGYDGFGGNVRLLTDATGTVTDTYDFDTWGNAVNTTGTTPNVYLYRGEQYDADLGLYYLRARYFNPLTGRFLTRDPDSGRPQDPATLHKCLYASADPVNELDPSGR